MALTTYIIDGDKGGVGKSMVARALTHYFVTKPAGERPKLAIYDADRSNPDVCGEGGLRADPSVGIVATGLIDLATETGWIEFAEIISRLAALGQKNEVVCIVNMPAQIGTTAFDGSIGIVKEVLREANAVPIWLLSRTQESLRALNYRVKRMPSRYKHGLIVKNLFFGSADKFLLWEQDDLYSLVADGHWMETEIPELNDVLTVKIARRPFHEALNKGIDGEPLTLGYQLALKQWLERTNKALEVIEHIADLQNSQDGEDE